MVEINLSVSLRTYAQQQADDAGISLDEFVANCITEQRQNQPPERDHPPAEASQRTSSVASPHLLATILQLSSDAIICFDETLHICHFNHGAETIFGYTADEAEELSLDHLLPDGIEITHAEHIKAFAQSPTQSRHMARRQRVYGKRKTGALFPADVSISKLQTTDGMIYTAIVRDDTQHQDTINKFKDSDWILNLISRYTTDMISLHHPDGVLVYANEAGQRTLGYSIHEVYETDIPFPHAHPDDRPRLLATYDQLGGDQLTVDVTYRYQKADGDYIWLQTRSSSILDDDGNVKYILSISRDITAFKETEAQLRQERDLLAGIMEASPSGISVVDANGELSFQNKHAEDILGAPSKVLRDRRYDSDSWQHTDYDGNPWPDEKQPFVRVMKTKEPVWDVRHAIQWDDGTRVYLAINGMPMFDDDGEITKVVFTLEDYTERKLQQDELEAALEREKHLNNLKSKFVSMVSHEFRTPLAIIMTATGALRLHHDRLSAHQIRDRLERIETQVQRLNTLIDDVTFINKQELLEQTVNRQQMDFDAFLQQVVGELKSAFDNTVSIELDAFSKLAPMLLDEHLIYKIVVNLLTNAVKYSKPGNTVRVRYGIRQETLHFKVKDHGIGIPEADQDDLFSLFHRASNVGTISGTGLGLTIVKHAVNALGGQIHFQSEEGKGTTFHVQLPAYTANETTAATSS